MRISALTLALMCFATSAGAQDAADPFPLQVQKADETGNAILPANTLVLVRTNQEITTKGKSWNEGDTFDMSVVHDVTLGDYVIIPRDSHAVGRISYLTDKGMFGKSGKMEVEIQYAEVRGRRIPLKGTYRQEGEGNTVATVATTVLTTVGGVFITGRSAVIPQGREFMATTARDLELAIPASEVGSAESKLVPLKPSGTLSGAIATSSDPVAATQD